MKVIMTIQVKSCLPFLFLLPFLFSNTCKAQENKDTELVEAIIGTTWIHAHEEDEENVTAYRSDDYNFPPSRGREGFRMEQDSTFLFYAIAPTDGIQMHKGHWKVEDGLIVARFVEGKAPVTAIAFQVLSLEEGVLKIKELKKIYEVE